MFEIAYLPVNQAWCVLWNGHQISVGEDCKLIFNSREELVITLERQKLKVHGNIVTGG